MLLLFLLTLDWGKLSEGLFNFAVAALPVATFLFKQWCERLKQAKEDKSKQELQERINELEKRLYGSQPSLHPQRDDVLPNSGATENLKHSKRAAD